MKIIIKISTGGSISLDVDSSTQFRDIKAIIEEKKGIPIAAQRIIISRKIVSDWQTLQDYSAEVNSTLYLVVSFNDQPSPILSTSPLPKQVPTTYAPTPPSPIHPSPKPPSPQPSPNSPSPHPSPKSGNEKTVYYTTCTVCQKQIQRNELFYYSGYPYHKKCIKCMVCNKQYDVTQNMSDYISIAPTLFLCRDHYQKYLSENELPKETHDKYHEINKKNFVANVLEPINYLKDEETKNYPEDEIFITSDQIDNSYQMNKPFDDFVPTIEFHFDKPINEIDFNQLQDFIGANEIMLGAKEGSFIIKLTFLVEFVEKITNVADKLKNKFKEFVDTVKDKFVTSMGKSIVGNFISDPKVISPDPEKIQEWYNKPSMNFLQNPYELNNTEINDIMLDAINAVKDEKVKRNWQFILGQEKIYNEAEEKVRKDIEENPFEMVIVGVTIIPNKYDEEYEKIKDLLKEDSIETFLYHGSNLANHVKIVNTHFYMPGQDKNIKQLDSGYYGKGIYATENLFYATIYGNHYSLLLNNQKTSIIYCKAIYNKNKVRELDHLISGQVIGDDIKNNYGIHHALVGNKTGFRPIKNNDIINNDIVAGEFVFPTKYQIIPIFSFTIMKSDHLILWKDENIENNENSVYMKELAKKMQLNIYSRKTWEDALEVVKKKKYNKIKLITNGGNGLTGKKLIEEARKIIGTNFVCLVFAASPKHIEWVTQMENVLFTTQPEAFKKFAALNMNKVDVLNYIGYLQKLEKTTFKINDNDLLKFPLAEKKISF